MLNKKKSILHAFPKASFKFFHKECPMMKPKMLTLEMKLEILSILKTGETTPTLGRAYSVNESSIQATKNTNKIKSTVKQSTALSAMMTTRVRNPVSDKS